MENADITNPWRKMNLCATTKTARATDYQQLMMIAVMDLRKEREIRMTVEQIELRKILTQMLADNEINRETILDFVKEIVDEKVEKAVNQMVHERDMDSLIHSRTSNIVDRTIRDEVANKVRRTMGSVSISIECHTPKEDSNASKN